MNKFKLWIFIAAVALVQGCSDDQIPSGSTVAIEPDTRTIDITPYYDQSGNCVWFDDYYLDVPLTIRVYDESNRAIGDVEISVYTDWSGNTFSGVEALKLYDDTNGNGVVDDPAELVSGADDAIYTTQTPQYTGDKFMLLRINLSCDYRGTITAVAGGTVGTMDVSLQVRDTGAETGTDTDTEDNSIAEVPRHEGN